jgi:RHS repeat-associated protein
MQSAAPAAPAGETAEADERPDTVAGEPGDVNDLPPLQDLWGDPGIAAPELEVPTGDFSDRPGEAGEPSFDPETSVEIPDRTTATAKTYRNADGTETTEYSLVPVRYLDETGAWKDVDLELVADAATGALVPAGSDSGLVVGSDIESSGLLSVDSPVGPVSVSMPDVVEATGELSADSDLAKIEGHAGLEVTVRATATGFEQSLVVPTPSGPSSYRLDFTLPAGSSARPAPSGIEIVDTSGTIVAEFGGGVAYDANGAEAAVTTTLVGQAGPVATVEVSADPAWFAASDRTFPVVIDPTWTSGSAPEDTYVKDGSNTSQWSSTTLQAGKDSGAKINRSLVRFGSLPSPNANYGVTEAHLSLYNDSATTCSARGLEVRGLAAAFNSSTIWSNQPATDAYGVVSTTAFNKGYTGCGAGSQNVDVTDLAQRWLDGTQTNYGFQLAAEDEADAAGWKRFHSGNGITVPTLSITYQTVPSAPSLSAPADSVTLTTRTPTLTVGSVTDPDTSGSVRYWYRLWTEASGDEEGQVVDSGWKDETSWTVPQGYLANGTTWRWKVFATDESGASVTTSTFRTLSLDFRLGGGHASPTDQVGPVSVNLVSGNGTLSVPGGGVSTLGGGISIGFTYNSQDVAPNGLSGAYYNDGNTPLTFDDDLVMVRTDPQANFDWGLDSPNPKVNDDNFLVRWTGTVKVPANGNYYFGASHDDAVKITVNSTVALNEWALNSPSATPEYGSSVSLTANTEVPITVDMAEGSGTAGVVLYAKSTDAPLDETVVPASWLTPGTNTGKVLPDRWSMSAPGAGFVAYTGISVANNAATLQGVGGFVEEFRLNLAGGWDPPTGSHATLSQADDGTFTLHSDHGTIYVFNVDGTVKSATSAVDSEGSTAPTYTWTNVTSGSQTFPRLSAIHDPVSGRDVTLTWKTTSNSCPDSASTPPVGMLCSIGWWDGTETTLSYGSSGELSGITAPGEQLTTFGYYLGNMVATVDPFTNEAIVAGVRGSGGDIWTVLRWITYDTATPTERKVTAVSEPAPLLGASQPGHTYTYESTTTEVDVQGLTQPNNYWREVGFDSDGRHTTDSDAEGRTTTTTWDADNERVRWVDDPAGLRTSAVYDDRGAVTDTYGPAPATWFNDEVPQSGYAASTPHSLTGYDEGYKGLAGAWWDNAEMSGDPVYFDTGLGDSHGKVDHNWSTGAPPGLPSDGWSGRLTGTITFPNSGPYTLQLNRRGAVRLYLDDALLLDKWHENDPYPVSGTTPSVTAGSRHRITIEFADLTSDALIGLLWTPPGGSQTHVPGTNLFPDYGLQTSYTDATGREAAPVYANPALGRQTAAKVDPDTMALQTSMTYETPGAGKYGRSTTRTLPAGNAWTYSHYTGVNGATPAETRDNPCTEASDAANQGAALKTRTGPTPASGSAIIEETVYDAAGRAVATRVGSESWTCMTYDERGRLIERETPTFGGESGRTVAYDHAVDDNPLVTEVADSAGTITTTTDLLGRPVETTDVWNKTTTFTYDQPGRLLEREGPEGSQEYTYNAAGQVTAQKLDGSTVATVAYSSNGRVQSHTYPSGTGNGGNGTSSANLTYDDQGNTTSLEWRTPSSTQITKDQVSYDLAGRVKDQSIDGTDTYTSGDNFTYDAAGRLTGARVPGHVITYNFAASGGCGASAAAGKNTNRTSVVDNSVTKTFCYDNADRLTSTTMPGYDSGVAYDAHGNLVTAADDNVEIETYTYDVDNRQLSTSQTGSGDVRYMRDATDQIIERKVDGTSTGRYSGPAVLDTSGNVVERIIGLPGGVTLTKRSAGDVWSYPNIRGEIVATANSSGVKQGSTINYDPYGQALSALPDNAKDDFDLGWTGQRFTEHESGVLNHIQMGARQYSPALGRFLETDPIEGGSANDYEYAAGDPVNLADHAGTSVTGCNPGSWNCFWDALGWIVSGAKNMRVKFGVFGLTYYFSLKQTKGIHALLDSLGGNLVAASVGWAACSFGSPLAQFGCSVLFAWKYWDAASNAGTAYHNYGCLTLFVPWEFYPGAGIWGSDFSWASRHDSYCVEDSWRPIGGRVQARGPSCKIC